jgi:hypothetical protein
MAQLGNWGHCNENPIYVFLFWELRGPTFHIHMSVSGLYTVFLESVRIYGCSKIDKPFLEIQYVNWDTEHYNSVLEIRRLPNSFISGNTEMGTRQLYWILTRPSFAVWW